MFILKLKEVYVIRRKDFNDPRYFFHTLDNDTTIDLVRWTPVIARAKEFITEEAVETFKYEFLKDRPCEIIRIEN